MKDTETTRAEPVRQPVSDPPAQFALGSLAPDLRLAGALGNQAFTQLVRSRALVARDKNDSFSDDPLDAGGFDDAGSIRVKPGPVRTTMIRPGKLQAADGSTFTQQSADPGAWAQAFLSFFGFRPELGLTGGSPRYWFNQQVHDLTWILDRMVEQAPLDNVTLTREKALSAATAALPPGAPSPSGTRTSLYLSFSLTDAVHAPPSSPTKTGKPDPVGEQVGAQYTLEIHPENKSGCELSWVAQLGWAKDAGGENKLKVQQILSGVQAAYVFAFLDGALQVTPLAQALGGWVRGEGKKDGIVKLRPAVQAGAGGQVAYSVDSGGHLSVGGQVAATWTNPAGADSTVDYGAQLFLQWKF